MDWCTYPFWMSLLCQRAPHHLYISSNMYLDQRKKMVIKSHDYSHKQSKCKCEHAGIPSADFTKCLWAWQSSVVESMISPYVLSCLLWISSSVLVNLSLMFGSVMDVMIFGYQAGIGNKTETMLTCEREITSRQDFVQSLYHFKTIAVLIIK